MRAASSRAAMSAQAPGTSASCCTDRLPTRSGRIAHRPGTRYSGAEAGPLCFSTALWLDGAPRPPEGNPHVPCTATGSRWVCFDKVTPTMSCGQSGRTMPCSLRCRAALSWVLSRWRQTLLYRTRAPEGSRSTASATRGRRHAFQPWALQTASDFGARVAGNGWMDSMSESMGAVMPVEHTESTARECGYQRMLRASSARTRSAARRSLRRRALLIHCPRRTGPPSRTSMCRCAT